MKKTLILGGLAVALTLAGMPVSTEAASLCVPGPNADGLSVTDVTLGASNATNCYGVVSGNNSNDNINTVGGGAMLFGDAELWGTEIKDDPPGAPGGTGSFYGLDWTLTASTGTSGTWTLSFVDTNPSALDFSADILFVLKGSNNYAAYYFDDFVFTTTSNGGTWNIQFVNNGGSEPNLSHASLYFRDGTDIPDCVPGTPDCPDPPDDVPEPTTMALFDLALLGAGIARRRR